MDFVGYGLQDLLEIVSYLVTSVSLIGLWYAYIFSKKQIHFTAMDKCIKEFRQISTPTFLESDNKCFIYDVRPKACREFPHTDRKKFQQISDLTLKNVAVCPAAFTIVEEMKKKIVF